MIDIIIHAVVACGGLWLVDRVSCRCGAIFQDLVCTVGCIILICGSLVTGVGALSIHISLTVPLFFG